MATPKRQTGKPIALSVLEFMLSRVCIAFLSHDQISKAISVSCSYLGSYSAVGVKPQRVRNRGHESDQQQRIVRDHQQSSYQSAFHTPNLARRSLVPASPRQTAAYSRRATAPLKSEVGAGRAHSDFLAGIPTAGSPAKKLVRIAPHPVASDVVAVYFPRDIESSAGPKKENKHRVTAQLAKPNENQR